MKYCKIQLVLLPMSFSSGPLICNSGIICHDFSKSRAVLCSGLGLLAQLVLLGLVFTLQTAMQAEDITLKQLLATNSLLKVPALSEQREQMDCCLLQS